VAEDIDRLFIDLPEPRVPGDYEFVGGTGTTHTRCSMGDDGCEDSAPGGTLRISSVSAGCVRGEVDFGALAEGPVTVPPC
jgi:hypothetical protein